MKKGDLNLSIQVIVVIVIAFVVLGLGLNFVRSQFRNIEETAGSVQEQVRQQILDDLRTGNKKLSFPSTSINIEKGKTSLVIISSLGFFGLFSLILSCPGSTAKPNPGPVSLTRLSHNICVADKGKGNPPTKEAINVNCSAKFVVIKKKLVCFVFAKTMA